MWPVDQSASHHPGSLRLHSAAEMIYRGSNVKWLIMMPYPRLPGMVPATGQKGWMPLSWSSDLMNLLFAFHGAI